MKNNPPVTRCPHCRLTQFRPASGLCRRCQRPFLLAAALPAGPILPAERKRRAEQEILLTRLDLPKKIARCRRALGLTQTALAEKMNLPRTYISRIERGRIMPLPPTLRKLANYMGMSLAELLRSPEEDISIMFLRLSAGQQLQVLERARTKCLGGAPW